MNSTIRFSVFVLAASIVVGASAGAPAQQANMTFFVTSAGSGKGADLGGLAGADRICQQLAQAAGAGSHSWHAYLGAQAADGQPAVNARDRIGKGPWQNVKGVVVSKNLDELHGDNNISKQTALTEKGERIKVRGDTPNMHDMLTGSDMQGRAFPGNMNLTCSNWSSSDKGSAMLGHGDREGIADTVYQHSPFAAHMSRSCSQPDLVATGGSGLFYCFAQ